MDAEDFKKKTSSILATVIIGIVVISFMFGGYDTLKRGAPENVAKVGAHAIKFREFRGEYERQLQFFRMRTGSEPDSRMSEELKQATMRNLIQTKLALILAEGLGVQPSAQEVRDEILNLPYFKRDGKFDIDLYKNLLAQNQLSPVGFEESIREDLERKGVMQLFRSFPISQGTMTDIERFRSTKVHAMLAQLVPNSMSKYLTIQDGEIAAYLANNENLAKVQATFNERKAMYDRPEAVKVRHILIKGTEDKAAETEKKASELATKVNVKNFAEMAEKLSEDPSAKGKGGDLGWITHGEMLKEFEDVAFAQNPGTISTPVKTSFGYHLILTEAKRQAQDATFEEYKKQIANELIQKSKTGEVKQLATKISEEIKGAMEKGDSKKIKELQSKYAFSFDENAEINKYDGNKGQVNLRSELINKLFALKGTDVQIFDDPMSIVVAKMVATPVTAQNATDKAKEEQSADMESLAGVMGQKFAGDVLKNMEQNVSIKVFDVIQ